MIPRFNDKQHGAVISDTKQIKIDAPAQAPLFDISEFAKRLREYSVNEDYDFYFNSQHIVTSDITSGCILQTWYRLHRTPVPDLGKKWPIIHIRAAIGKAIHKLIQQVYPFTETEVSVRVPSIRFSGRIDAIINDNCLVEIKTCAYRDYEGIIRTSKPRDADFLQLVTYKYILENHLTEAKQQTDTRTPPPRLDRYNIELLQLIYVAHDMVSDAYCDTYDDVTKSIMHDIRGGKYSDLYFMKVLTFDLSKYDISEHINYVVEKLEEINKYLDRDIEPPIDHKFIDTKQCFFCVYKSICPVAASKKRG